MKKPENKTRNQMTLRDFSVNHVRQWDTGGISADLTINGVQIYGVRVIEGRNGDFLSYPSRKGSDGKYYNHVYCDLSAEDQGKVLAEIERKLNE